MSNKKVRVGSLLLGDGKIYIQSMLNIPAGDVEGTVRQAKELEAAGCEIIRAAIPAIEDVRLIPALKNAEYLRYGVMHRNTFILSPAVLNADFSFKYNRNVRFAGQITGVEGYVESAASGLFAAAYLLDELTGNKRGTAPGETMTGALAAYLTAPNKDF